MFYALYFFTLTRIEARRGDTGLQHLLLQTLIASGAKIIKEAPIIFLTTMA